MTYGHAWQPVAKWSQNHQYSTARELNTNHYKGPVIFQVWGRQCHEHPPPPLSIVGKSLKIFPKFRPRSLYLFVSGNEE